MGCRKSQAQIMLYCAQTRVKYKTGVTFKIMKKSLLKYKVIIALTIIAIFMVQCNKSTPPHTTPVIIKTAITNISPLQGLNGTIVTISGAGFDTVIATTNVKFNGKAAAIKSITATQMIVEVPADATTGEITVTNKDKVIVFPANFTVNSFTIVKFPAVNTFYGNAISNIAADAAGNIYCNTQTDTVFKILPSGDKSTLAIAGSTTTKLGGIAVDAAGNVYAVGTNDFKIYKITTAGAVSVFAGSGVSGYADGLGAGAQFTAPAGMAIDGSGNLFVTDVYRVRKITPAGQVSVLAGNATAGRTDGQGTSATFGSYGTLKNIATDTDGNIYVSDGNNGDYDGDNNTFYIRKITPSGAVSSIGPMPLQRNNWGQPLILPFTSLLAVDAAGNLFLPGSRYNTGTNASGGCCSYGPMFMVNKALYSSQFFDLLDTFSFVTMTYTGITFDASGNNMYISAAVSYGYRFYEPASKGSTGSLVLKVIIK